MHHIAKRILNCFVLLIHFSIHGMQELPPEYAPNLAAHASQTLNKLKRRMMCQTHPIISTVHSSKKYRAMAFEALQNCGHPHPEVVMLLNDKNQSPACTGTFYKEKYIGINLDEKVYSQYTYGNQRAALHHEAAHIINQEYTTDKTHPAWHRKSQNEERTADHVATINAGCVTCARESAQYFLSNHASTEHTHPLLKAHENITLADLDHMSSRVKKKLIRSTYRISRKKIKSHPIYLERAIRIHLDSLRLGEVLCAYHQNQDQDEIEQ